MRRELEYGLTGLVILYIVFATRPAPLAIRQLLSNPIGHLVVLGGIVYIGAFQSLLLALVLGVAYVASAPHREGADDTLSKKCKEGEEYDTKEKKCVPKKDKKPEPKKPEAPNSKSMPSPSKPITTTPPPPSTETPSPAPKSKAQANGTSDEDPAKKEKVMPASEFESFVSGGGIAYGPY